MKTLIVSLMFLSGTVFAGTVPKQVASDELMKLGCDFSAYATYEGVEAHTGFGWFRKGEAQSGSICILTSKLGSQNFCRMERFDLVHGWTPKQANGSLTRGYYKEGACTQASVGEFLAHRSGELQMIAPFRQWVLVRGDANMFATAMGQNAKPSFVYYRVEGGNKCNVSMLGDAETLAKKGALTIHKRSADTIEAELADPHHNLTYYKSEAKCDAEAAGAKVQNEAVAETKMNTEVAGRDKQKTEALDAEAREPQSAPVIDPQQAKADRQAQTAIRIGMTAVKYYFFGVVSAAIQLGTAFWP